MRCTEWNNIAIRGKIFENYGADLKCVHHLETSPYRNQFVGQTELLEHLFQNFDCFEKYVIEAQLFISTMKSGFFYVKLNEEKRKQLKMKNRFFSKVFFEFQNKINGIDLNLNFDIFIMIRNGIYEVRKDLSEVHELIGPCLSQIYSHHILEKVISSGRYVLDYDFSSFSGESQNFDGDDEEEQKISLKEIKIDSSSNIVFSKSSSFAKGDKSTKELSESLQENEHNPEIDEIRGYCLRRPGHKIDNLITLLATTKEELIPPKWNCQIHIDFLHLIRDQFFECRAKIDKYIQKFDLKPSDSFDRKRIVIHNEEISNLLVKHKFYKKGFMLRNNSEISLDFKELERWRNFFEEAMNFNLPKIKKLDIINLYKADYESKTLFNEFICRRIVLPIKDFVFDSGKIGKDIMNFSEFSEHIGPLLRKVQTKVTISGFKFGNNDLKKVIDNLWNAEDLEFKNWDFFNVTEDLIFEDRRNHKLLSLIIELKWNKKDNEKIKQFILLLMEAMRTTDITETLKSIKVNRPLMPEDMALETFKDMGFNLDQAKMALPGRLFIM
jgi:hypothetical protein